MLCGRHSCRHPTAGHLAVPAGSSFCLSPFLLLFLASSLPPSPSFLGIVLVLEKKAPALVSNITKERKIKNTTEKYPMVILEVRRGKITWFYCPFWERCFPRNGRGLERIHSVLRPRMDILRPTTPSVRSFSPSFSAPLLCLTLFSPPLSVPHCLSLFLLMRKV